MPGIRSTLSRQPAPLTIGEQALAHRSRHTNTGSGSEPRRPAQKRKTPEPRRRAANGEGTQRHSTSLTSKTDSHSRRGAPRSEAATGGAGPSTSEISNGASSGATCGGLTSNDAFVGGYSGGTSRDVPPGTAFAINNPSMGGPPVGVSTVGGAPPMGASPVGGAPPAGVGAGDAPLVGVGAGEAAPVGGVARGGPIPVSTIRLSTQFSYIPFMLLTTCTTTEAAVGWRIRRNTSYRTTNARSQQHNKIQRCSDRSNHKMERAGVVRKGHCCSARRQRCSGNDNQLARKV